MRGKRWEGWGLKVPDAEGGRRRHGGLRCRYWLTHTDTHTGMPKWDERKAGARVLAASLRAGTGDIGERWLRSLDPRTGGVGRPRADSLIRIPEHEDVGVDEQHADPEPQGADKVCDALHVHLHQRAPDGGRGGNQGVWRTPREWDEGSTG